MALFFCCCSSRSLNLSHDSASRFYTASAERSRQRSSRDSLRLFLFLTFCVAFWLNPVARAGDDAVYMVGLEVHASRSVTPADAEKISRYLFHNIANGAAIVVYEGDTRGGSERRLISQNWKRLIRYLWRIPMR
jgi:hypothetical protein